MDYNINIIRNEPISYIYMISNIDTTMSYIGQTKNIEKRFEEHLTGKGSKLLLKDIVMNGISKFKFQILNQIYTVDINVDELEDDYIESYNTLHPNGFNQRLNRQIVPTGITDHERIEIIGKYVFSNGEYKVFSVGEFTSCISYQILTNITEPTSFLNKRNSFGYRYFQVSVLTEREFENKKSYSLNLKLTDKGFQEI